MTSTLQRPAEAQPQPKGPDHRIERQPGKFGLAMQKIGHNVLRLVHREGTPKQERRVGGITSATAGIMLLATAATGGIAATQAPEHQGTGQEQVDPGVGVDTGEDTDNGSEQTPDTIPSLEQTPEQLAAPFVIPADTKPEDLPDVVASKLEMLQNAGQNPVDMPAQNWDPNDPHINELATTINTAGQGALFPEGEPTYVNDYLAANIYYYGKTSFEAEIYPDTKPYTTSIETVSYTVIDNGDGTYTYTQTIRTRDNALQNSVQNQAREQGDSDGMYDSTSEITYTSKVNGNQIQLYGFNQTTTIPNAK